MAPKKKALGFERGLERLEVIAGQMERGELPLDEMLKLYEEGMKLSAELNQKLVDASSRMMEVKQEPNGDIILQESDIAQQQSLLDDLLDE